VDDVRVDTSDRPGRVLGGLPDVLAGPPSDIDEFCGVLAAALAGGAGRSSALRLAVAATPGR
jgi:hypothetical protein